MLNLVGNSCIASYITRDCIKQPFVNPFCWSIMDFPSCYNLVKYWDSINFTKFKLIKDSDWNFSILIDGKVTVKYVHYLFKKDAAKIEVHGTDVYWNRIWEYIVSKYIHRTKHIRETPPIFLFATANSGLLRHKAFSLNEQEQIASLGSPYKIIMSFDNIIEAPNCITIKQTDRFTYNGRPLSNFIFEQIKPLLNI